MKVIGVTGKSGTGKSYIARKICKNFQNSKMISMDELVDQLMNQSKIIEQLKTEFPDEENLVQNGKINLELILSNKEIFAKIYSLIEDDLNKLVLSQTNEYRDNGTDTVVIEWWGLPKTNLINLCDCSVYIDSSKRLQALEKREKYISQEDIDVRDDVLAVDYEKCDYDVVVENDMTEETINIAIKDIQEELETPTMDVEMHLEEFKQLIGQTLSKYNDILNDKQKRNPSEITAYTMLIQLRKTKNILELGGSFKKSLKATISEQDKAKYIAKINEIIAKAKSEFPEDEISQDNIEEILKGKSQPMAELIIDCKSEIKQASLDTNHSITSAIYRSPEELTDGKLNRSKDVLNMAGEIGDYTFAQSGTLVDNPYVLRKSGKGVCQDRDICIPGETDLVCSENGRAILSEPVYVYIMRTDEFEPVVSIANKDSCPRIDFSGEWTSERDIDRMDMRVKQYTDVTEMLEYMQIFSTGDRETFEQLANSSYEDKVRQVTELSEQGKIHYINGECDINVKEEYLNDEKTTITKKDIVPVAKKDDVVMEKENVLEVVQQLERIPEKENEKNNEKSTQ